jgi:hypothetical protein
VQDDGRRLLSKRGTIDVPQTYGPASPTIGIISGVYSASNRNEYWKLKKKNVSGEQRAAGAWG